METFDLLERETGHHVAARVLVTLYPGRSAFVKAVLKDIQTHLPDRCLKTFIRYSIKLAEAASHETLSEILSFSQNRGLIFGVHSSSVSL